MLYGGRMASPGDALRAAVADAISGQIAGKIDESTLPREVAIRITAERLVQEALSRGHGSEAEVGEVRGFAAGRTAMGVARVHARLSFVVKVDTSPSLVDEAHLLLRMSTDRSLPESTRRAFPAVYAIDDEGPIYGYLMEDLDDYAPIHLSLGAEDGSAGALIAGFWSSVLEPAYRSTRQSRLAHDLWEDYFGRGLARLHAAASVGALPAGDAPLAVALDGETVEFPEGWASEIESVRSTLAASSPGFSTWVHGDPNPENAMWAATESGPTFRALDPKDWWSGDYLHDVAKLGHYVVVTHPIESGAAQPVQARDAGLTVLSEDALAAGRRTERDLLDRVALFAEEVGDRAWRLRYDLGFAANLLSIAGPRAMKAEERGPAQRDLADFALAYGLVTLRRAVSATGV